MTGAKLAWLHNKEQIMAELILMIYSFQIILILVMFFKKLLIFLRPQLKRGVAQPG